MTINQRLFNTLEEKHLKQADLARILNVRTSVIASWKTRGSNPPVDYIAQICEFLNISIYELLGIEPKYQSELEYLYSIATQQDKDTIDFILSRYKDNQEQSSTSMIG